MLVMSVSRLSKIKSSAIYPTAATSIRVSNQEDAAPITSNSLLFRLLRKKGSEIVRSRDVAYSRPSKDSHPRRGHVGLASWIPDNGKNLVPRRTIGRRHFQREERFFVPPRHAFRFSALPPPRLSPRVITSFSPRLPSRLLFLLFHISCTPQSFLWTQSRFAGRSFSSLFNATLRLPFILTQKSLQSPASYSEFRESMQSRLHQFREFRRS